MKIRGILMLIAAGLFIFSGCAMRTYEIQQERIDQDLTTGNRGLIKGAVPRDDIKDRKTTRPVRVLELEIPSLKKNSVPSSTAAGQQGEPSRGSEPIVGSGAAPEPVVTVFEDYKVQQYDTLQKIAQKLYGSINKWSRIYDANRDILKSPDSIYPGQTLKIPAIEMTK